MNCPVNVIVDFGIQRNYTGSQAFDLAKIECKPKTCAGIGFLERFSSENKLTEGRCKLPVQF